jgi:hypothetical protein
LAKDVTVLKEDIIPNDIPTREMTTDCHFVHHKGGVDVVRGVSMSKIFDYYYDLGKKITKIEVAGGQLNPKLCEPFPKKKDK